MADSLQQELTAKATELDVPGVALGVLIDGVEHYASFGVTSVENPLEVNEETLFQFGSTGKTFTATAIMRLVEQGRLSLTDKVRQHVPELVLKDESVAAEVTVLQLLNHTAGWDGDFFTDTGDGDDALERYVALMADLTQVNPLGAAVSYNNASLVLAGRLIEKVTGRPFASAIQDLLLDPLGLTSTFLSKNQIMTRRFAVGHALVDGTQRVVRPWGMSANVGPAGGIAGSARDQIAWARFHLGDGTGPDGSQVLSKASLDLMKQPTALCPGNALGDAIGISWLLSTVDGEPVAKHGGTTIGQYSAFVLVPGRSFAIISMTNGGPGGAQVNKHMTEWALEHFLGLKSEAPEAASLTAEELEQYTGTFQSISGVMTLRAGEGVLLVDVVASEETKKAMAAMGADPDVEQPTIPIAVQAADPDRFVGTEGPAAGLVGSFLRDENGRVTGVSLGGRVSTRIPARA
ncbi:MAG: Beta-lactamase [Frankiales bacterium]|nr:Beta-lactamase [Frankiales bacterium]